MRDESTFLVHRWISLSNSVLDYHRARTTDRKVDFETERDSNEEKMNKNKNKREEKFNQQNVSFQFFTDFESP